MSKYPVRRFGLAIPVFILTLNSCSAPNLQEDPRQSKFAALVKEDLPTAAKKLDRELQRDPNSLQALYWRATIEVENGNLQDGQQRLDSLLERYPNYSFAYSERARADIKSLQYEKALSDASLAIRYRPDVARNYARRALAYLLLHKPDKALEDLRTADKLGDKEDYGPIKLSTGKALMNLDRYQEAIPVLSQAIAANGKEVRGWERRALCYARLKDWKKAKDDCNHAAALDPKDLAVKVLHGALLSATGERDAARQYLTQTFKNAPDERIVVDTADLGQDVPSVADAALACMAAGHPQSARAMLTLVQGNRPLDTGEVFTFAKAELVLGDRFRAAKLLNECLASNPTFVEPRVALIKLYAGDNLMQKARDVQREGLALPLSDKDRRMVASALR